MSADLEAHGIKPAQTLDNRLRQGVAEINTSLGSAADAQPAAIQRLRQLAALVLVQESGQATGTTALATAQTRQGMKEAQSLPAFDVSQPAGSSHVTVYVFTLGGR